MKNSSYGWCCLAVVVGGVILTGSFQGSIIGMLILIGLILKDK